MKKRTLTVIVILLFSSIPILDSAAREFLTKTDRQIVWQDTFSNARFSAYQLKNEIEITFHLQHKKIIVRIEKNADNLSATLLGHNITTGKTETFSEEDASFFNQLLRIAAKENLGHAELGFMTLRAINLLANWPEGKPLQIKFEKTESSASADRGDFSAADIDDVCEKVNQLHDGGYPVFFIWRPFFDREVGPHPWEQGECMGRCGRKCAGDGPPDNGLSIFSQDCFNHDVCVEDQGELNLDCMLIFDDAFDDFLFGPSCQKDNVDIKINNNDGPLTLTDDEILDIRLSIQNVPVSVWGDYLLSAETSTGTFWYNEQSEWILSESPVVHLSATLQNFTNYQIFDEIPPEEFPLGEISFHFYFRHLDQSYEDAVEINLLSPVFE